MQLIDGNSLFLIFVDIILSVSKRRVDANGAVWHVIRAVVPGNSAFDALNHHILGYASVEALIDTAH